MKKYFFVVITLGILIASLAIAHAEYLKQTAPIPAPIYLLPPTQLVASPDNRVVPVVEAAPTASPVATPPVIRSRVPSTPEPTTAVPTPRVEYSNYDTSKLKSADDHYQWDSAHSCYTESNQPGIFHEVPKVGDGYDPNWLADGGQGIDSPCHFYFHPTQGRENNPPSM